jgi:hypothetical protein
VTGAWVRPCHGLVWHAGSVETRACTSWSMTTATLTWVHVCGARQTRLVACSIALCHHRGKMSKAKTEEKTMVKKRKASEEGDSKGSKGEGPEAKRVVK